MKFCKASLNKAGNQNLLPPTSAEGNKLCLRASPLCQYFGI